MWGVIIHKMPRGKAAVCRGGHSPGRLPGPWAMRYGVGAQRWQRQSLRICGCGGSRAISVGISTSFFVWSDVYWCILPIFSKIPTISNKVGKSIYMMSICIFLHFVLIKGLNFYLFLLLLSTFRYCKGTKAPPSPALTTFSLLRNFWRFRFPRHFPTCLFVHMHLKQLV